MGAVVDCIIENMYGRGYEGSDLVFERIVETIERAEGKYMKLIEDGDEEEFIKEILANLKVIASETIDDNYKDDVFKIIERIRKYLVKEDFIKVVEELHHFMIYLILFSKRILIF
jgi:hypothetical protein